MRQDLLLSTILTRASAASLSAIAASLSVIAASLSVIAASFFDYCRFSFGHSLINMLNVLVAFTDNPIVNHILRKISVN